MAGSYVWGMEAAGMTAKKIHQRKNLTSGGVECIVVVWKTLI